MQGSTNILSTDILPKGLSLNLNKDITDILLQKLNIIYTSETEIETRLGTIIDKKTNERISLPTKHAVIFTSNSENHRFVSGVNQNDFARIKNRFDGVECKRVVDKVVMDGRTRHVYHGTNLKECIDKERLVSVDLYCPEMEYDLRLSISRERMVDFKVSGNRNKFIRFRERDTFLVGDYKVEFTTVSNEKQGVTYEVEIEVVNGEFDKNEFITCIFNLQ